MNITVTITDADEELFNLLNKNLVDIALKAGLVTRPAENEIMLNSPMMGKDSRRILYSTILTYYFTEAEIKAKK